MCDYNFIRQVVGYCEASFSVRLTRISYFFHSSFYQISYNEVVGQWALDTFHFIWHACTFSCPEPPYKMNNIQKMMREKNQWSCGAPHHVIIIQFDESISNIIAISGKEMSIPNKKMECNKMTFEYATQFISIFEREITRLNVVCQFVIVVILNQNEIKHHLNETDCLSRTSHIIHLFSRSSHLYLHVKDYFPGKNHHIHVECIIIRHTYVRHTRLIGECNQWMTLQLKFILFYFIFKNCNVSKRWDFNRIECHSFLLSLWNHSLFSMESGIEFCVPLCDWNIDIEGIFDLMFHCYLPLMTLQLKTIIPETNSVIECAFRPADPWKGDKAKECKCELFVCLFVTWTSRHFYKQEILVDSNVWLGQRHITQQYTHSHESNNNEINYC